MYETLYHPLTMKYNTGNVTTIAGRPRTWGSVDGPALEAQFEGFKDLAVDQSDGSIYVIDGNSDIRKISKGITSCLFPSTSPAPLPALVFHNFEYGQTVMYRACLYNCGAQ